MGRNTTTALERLESLLNDKDDEIDELTRKVEELECSLRGIEHGWSRHTILDGAQTLPVPRLEIICTSKPDAYEMTWTYQLVYRHLLNYCVAVPLGTTKVTGGARPSIDSEGRVQLPYRDGCHIHHDMELLRLPGFAIYGDTVENLAETAGGYEYQHKVGLEHRTE